MERSKFNSTKFTVFFLCILGSIVSGNVVGLSAVLLPKLEEDKAITQDQKSYIASFSCIGQVFGALISAFCAHALGRKKTLTSMLFLMTTGFLMTTFSGGNFWILVIARFLQGFGVITTVAQVYLSEIATIESRSLMCAFGSIGFSAGIPLVYIYGTLLSWQVATLVCGLSAFVCTIGFALICPESPSWLCVHGREEMAKTILVILRPADFDIEKEIKARLATPKTGFSSMWNEMKRLPVIKASMLLQAIMVLHMLSGGNILVFYTVGFVKQLGSFDNHGYVPAIIISLIRLSGTLVSPLFMQKIGKKKLLIITSAIMATSIAALAVFLQFNEGTGLEQYVVPMVLLVIYMFSFGTGVGAVPWTLLGILTPPQVAPMTSGLATTSAYLALFIQLQFYPMLVEMLTLPAVLLIFAIFCIILALVASVFLPETYGKSTVEILESFGHINDDSKCQRSEKA